MFTGIVEIEQGRVVEHAPPQLVLGRRAVAAASRSATRSGRRLLPHGRSRSTAACSRSTPCRRRSGAHPRRPRAGSTVNLEPALRAGDRMGGHIVQGHVDGVGELVAAAPRATAVSSTFRAPEPCCAT